MTTRPDTPTIVDTPARGAWRKPAGLILFGHGAIHLLGVWWAFGLGEVEELGGPTLLDQQPGEPATIVFGVLWLAAALGLMAAGVMVVFGLWRAILMAAVAAGVSIIPTVVWWNNAWIGAVVSAVVLLAAALSSRSARFSPPAEEAR